MVSAWKGSLLVKVIIVTIAALLVVWYMGKSGILKPAAVGAVLYLVAVDASFNAYSAINSSPWTYENMSGDKGKAASGNKYVLLASAAAVVLGAFSSLLAASLWPLAGSVTVAAGMYLLYQHAMKVGTSEGNTDWKQSGNAVPSLSLVR